MPAYLTELAGQLAQAFGFFSRIPLPRQIAGLIREEDNLAGAVIVFPVAGLLIAIIPALTWIIAIQFLPALAAAGLAITAGILVTGGLHEDGLADCADGLGGSRDHKKSLEIMRDSRIGTFGALALIAGAGLRWVALASLAPAAGLLALLICHSAARAAISLAMQFSTSVRPQGLGNSVEDGMPEHGFAACAAVTLVIALLFGGFWGILAVAAGYGTAWLVLLWLNHRLGGYTGDGLGAMEQVAEITILLALAGFWAAA